MMTTAQKLADVQTLKGYMAQRLPKQNRNLGRYCFAPLRSQANNVYGQVLGYFPAQYSQEIDVPPPVNINVLSSAVDTITSKISQAKVRPYVTPSLGTWKTRKICRIGQLTFDRLFELQNVPAMSVNVLRDALIFEIGHTWVDDVNAKIVRIRPWDYCIDPSELNYGCITRCAVTFDNFPLYTLPEKARKHDRIKSAIDKNPFQKGEVVYYYNFNDGKCSTIVGGEVVDERTIGFKVSPVVSLYWKDPIRGAFSTSLVDEMYPYQSAIDNICAKVNDAATLSPANAMYIPTFSDIKPSMITNRSNVVYQYEPGPAGNGTPIVSSPRFIDPMYMDLLKFYIQTSYESQGISQMAAQGKKYPGVTAAKAIETLDDMESDRHNNILQKYMNFQTQIATRLLDVMPEGADLVPDVLGRIHGITWGDIKKARDLFTIQFSNTSTLSKDPQTRLEQINAMGLDPSTVAKYMEQPDLEDAFSGLTASYDDCQKVIERAIEKGQYEFGALMNLDQLIKECVTMWTRLDAADESPMILKRVEGLMNAAIEKKAKLAKAMETPGEPQAPEPQALPDQASQPPQAVENSGQLPQGGLQ
jgi:hypothetical protein